MADWNKAKDLIIGALSEVKKLSDSSAFPSSSGNSGMTPSSSSKSRNSSALEEHKKIFGFNPLLNRKFKGKKARSSPYASKKTKVNMFTKDCVCLKYQDQTWIPQVQERIELAKIGLGLKKISFKSDGDAQHIHDVVITNFPVLDSCGGYSLLRLKENSRKLVPIDSPDSGITAPFLKDILRQAKLYICPLQCDVSTQEAEKFCTADQTSNSEPEDFCMTCHCFFPMSQLRKHVFDGCQSSVVASVNASVDNASSSSMACNVSDMCTDTAPSEDFLIPVYDVPAAVTTCELKYSDSLLSSNSDEESLPVVRLSSDSQPGLSTYKNYVSLISDSSEQIDWQLEQDTQEAIDASAIDTISSVTEGYGALVDIIEEHRKKFLDSDKDNTYRITIRRNEIWKDAIQNFKSCFDESQHLRFTFLGEPAVDDGGPRREFFMLFMNCLTSQESLFEGQLGKRVLRHNTSALDKSIYKIVGKIIALSVMHGGPGPAFLADSVVNYIFRDGKPFQVYIEDVPDECIQMLLKKLRNCKDEAEMKEMLDSGEYEFRFSCGVSQSTYHMKLDQKEEVVSALCRHFTIYHAISELEQLIEGMKTLNFIQLIKVYPSAMRQIFDPPKHSLTADFIQDFYEVLYSEAGSNDRKREECVIMNWITYLRDSEDCVDDVASLKDIFIFLTGCDLVPPLGFPNTERTIQFDSQLVVPRVLTCSLIFFLPRSLPEDYQVFKERMTFFILGSQGFGQL